ncbi:MAG: DUF2127 domain-containing protein [Deltaproteobacteria bacterium]|nr:DUF2127 domain-containing protein [Deltaproteobacteria bacterium]
MGAWSRRLAEMVFEETTPGRLHLAALAIGLDGVLTGVEGWSLRRGYRWAPWLVIAATGSLLPWELVELSR